MWISKREWESLKKKVAILEEEQLRDRESVKKYVENDKILHEEIAKHLEEIPEKIIMTLQQNRLDK